MHRCGAKRDVFLVGMPGRRRIPHSAGQVRSIKYFHLPYPKKKTETEKQPHRSSSDCDLPSMGIRVEAPQYMRLGCLIKKLADLIGPKHNIHKDVKKMVANIQTVYERLGEELHTVSNEIQTSPTIQGGWAQGCETPKNVDGNQHGPKLNERKATSPHNKQTRQIKYTQLGWKRRLQNPTG